MNRTPLSQSAPPTRGDTAARRSRPLIVEIVGPAGAGKTALLRTLGRDPRVYAGVHIDRVRQFGEMLGHGVAILPIAVSLLSQGWRRWWYGLLHLVRLRTLPRAISLAAAGAEADVILLDEGPVFSLARLSVFQQANQGEGRLADAWHAELDRWSDLLDFVIWTDAPDAVLAERIRSRLKRHQIKDGSDAEVAVFLERYRQAYREILGSLTTGKRVGMVHLDTTGLAVDVAAGRLLAELEHLGLRRRD